MKHVKSLILAFSVAVLLYSCSQQTVSTNLENNQTDSLGAVISVITFEQKATGEDAKTAEDGVIPWISIDEPQAELGNLKAADEIVLPYVSATIIVDYPLSKPTSFQIKGNGKGFSRKDLIIAISEKYHQIYKEEEESAKIKTVSPEDRKGLINRNQTNGKYGIWGHDIGDLDLSQIEVHKNSKGEITLLLGIES